MSIFIKHRKENQMIKQLELYSKKNIIQYCVIILILVLFCGLLFFRIRANKLVQLALAGIIFGLICVFLYLWIYFPFLRKKLIKKVNKDDFKQLLNLVESNKNSDCLEIVIYGIWQLVQDNKNMQNVFYSKDYESDEVCRKEKILISYLNCITYRNGQRITRVPELIRPSGKAIEVITDYKEIFEKSSRYDKDVLSDKLIQMEKKYDEVRSKAKEEENTTSNDASILERFTVASNNPFQIDLIKIMLLVLAVICLGYDWLTKNDFTTAFFEICTIVLLLMDLTKDRDYKYLH